MVDPMRRDWIGALALALPIIARANVSLQDFPGAAAILSGLASPGESTLPQPGDRLLFAMESLDGGDVFRRLLLVEVVANDLRPGRPIEAPEGGWVDTEDPPRRVPNSSPFPWITKGVPDRWAMVRVLGFEADGRALGAAYCLIPTVVFERGFHGMAEIVTTGDGSNDERNKEALGRAIGGLMAFAELVASNPQTRPLLELARKRVMRSPGAGTKIKALLGKVNLAFSVDSERIRRLDDGSYDVEVGISAADKLLSTFVITAAASRAPLAISAGIARIESANLDDPKRTVSVRLLGSAQAKS